MLSFVSAASPNSNAGGSCLRTVYESMKDTAAFVAGGAVGAAVAVGALQYWYRREWNADRRQYSETSEKEQRPTSRAVQGSSCKLSDFTSDEVLSEQFTRNVQFFGQNGQLNIANAFVVVIGLGVSLQRRSLSFTRRHFSLLLPSMPTV